LTLVQADVDGSFEEDVVALGELEGLEGGDEAVAAGVGSEVLEQERVDRASAGRRRIRDRRHGGYFLLLRDVR